MFGTMGFSELIIILVIVLIIFGAGRLPQIGEGIGKALKGFKKEVHEIPPPEADPVQEVAGNPSAQPAIPEGQSVGSSTGAQGSEGAPVGSGPAASQPTAPYVPGPELTPGTTAAMMYGAAAPQKYDPPKPSTAPASHAREGVILQEEVPSMESRMVQPPPPPRASYPALPPNARPKPVAKRPSAVVNKDAVARVQAQQAAMKQASAPKGGGASPKDMQSLGEGLGDALRTFRNAAADVRGAIEPEMRTLKSEMDSAQKEIEQSVETAKHMPALHEDPPPST